MEGVSYLFYGFMLRPSLKLGTHSIRFIFELFTLDIGRLQGCFLGNSPLLYFVSDRRCDK
jgi:hypothetical protein